MEMQRKDPSEVEELNAPVEGTVVKETEEQAQVIKEPVASQAGTTSRVRPDILTPVSTRTRWTVFSEQSSWLFLALTLLVAVCLGLGLYQVDFQWGFYAAAGLALLSFYKGSLKYILLVLIAIAAIVIVALVETSYANLRWEETVPAVVLLAALTRRVFP